MVVVCFKEKTTRTEVLTPSGSQSNNKDNLTLNEPKYNLYVQLFWDAVYLRLLEIAMYTP
jgi:hypothetical protein